MYRKTIEKVGGVRIEGSVKQALSNGLFQVEFENGCTAITHLSGKIRRNRIRILVGDRVRVELSAYDLTRGRIVYRLPKQTKLYNQIN